MHEEPLPLDDPSIFYNDASYGMYNDMVHEPDSPDVEAESSDALVSLSQTGLPLVRASFQASPKVDYSHIGGYRSSLRSAKVTN
jgi:hypothetical protein